MATKDGTKGKGKFEAAAKEKRGFFKEWFGFVGTSKKWWLIPLVVVLLMLGGLLVLSGTVAAPFIYTLF